MGIKSLLSVNISVSLPQGGSVIVLSADRLNLETISKLVEVGSACVYVYLFCKPYALFASY